MKRTWHSGPPPHIGWWNASVNQFDDLWRWWNGECWSDPAGDYRNSKFALIEATSKNHNPDIKWTTYWPTNGRVPRINPATGEVTGKINGEEA